MTEQPKSVPVTSSPDETRAQVHESCAAYVLRRWPESICLSDSCYDIDFVTFDREDATALWPLLKRFAETGSLIDAAIAATTEMP